MDRDQLLNHLQAGTFVGELWLQLSYRAAAEMSQPSTPVPLTRSVSYDEHAGWRCGELWGLNQSLPCGLETLVEVKIIILQDNVASLSIFHRRQFAGNAQLKTHCQGHQCIEWFDFMITFPASTCKPPVEKVC